MTDEQIIKALECCDSYFDCEGCPCEEECGGLSDLTFQTLDLINRLTAENERLQTMHSEMCIGMKVIKRKAIEKFAERLKELVVYDTIRNYEITNGRTYELSEMVREDIDDLVEEMVGESTTEESSETKKHENP